MSVLGQPPSYQDTHLLTPILVTPDLEMRIHALSPPQDKSPPALITMTPGSEVDPVIDEYKQSIYRHPLFPLMAMVFEKCETVCASLDTLDDSDIDADIHSFIQHEQQRKQNFLTENTDLDNLLLKAIQVLRIHLLEMEKVRELCKDFCSRYITCLKGKLQSEHLLRLDDLDSPPLSPIGGSSTTDWTGATTVGAMTSAPMTTLGGMLPQPSLAMATISQGQIIAGNIVYQMVHTPQGIVAQPVQIQPPTLQTTLGNTMVQGSTPLSQIGMVTSPITTCQTTATPLNLSVDDSSLDDDDPLGKRRNAKRGVLPKQATQIMKTWLFQHLVHPYPTEDEKRVIASQTNLTLLQVNNWFINARRRILQPMLDSGEKAKKSKPVTRPIQRFWPEAIASITPQLPPELQSMTSSGEPSTNSATGHSRSSPPVTVVSGSSPSTATYSLKASSFVLTLNPDSNSGD